MSDSLTPEQSAAFNLSLLDPNALEVPKETFPVEVVVSELRWSAPEYNKGSQYRQAFPFRGPTFGPEGNSIQQWALQLKRLDAVFYHEDGSPFEDGQTTVPVTRWAGIDLEKMDKNGVIKPIMKTKSKEPFILGKWTAVAGALSPSPAVLVGKKFMVEHYRELEISPGYPAKNVTIPVEVLPPTYVYSGEVLRFKASNRDAEGNVATVTGGNVGSAGIDKGEAANLIRSFLSSKGLTAEGATVAILGDPDFPAQAKVEPFLTAAATGNLAATLDSYK